MNKKILITGAAGFIGFHVAKALVLKSNEVIGIDNLNNYYDVSLKVSRLAELGVKQSEFEYNRQYKNDNFSFTKLDISDQKNIELLFDKHKFDIVINIAAQPGVRYSLINPYAYSESNLVGFLNILEGCRKAEVEHLVFASSSSVYGLNAKIPYSTKDNVDHPISLYAATKKSNELMAHSYSHLYSIPVTGLRFFTVYGEWGRPDMSYFLFTKAIFEGKEINVFNDGRMERDFTYIDDIVNGILKVVDYPPKANLYWDNSNQDPSISSAPYKLYNIGNNKPVKLLDFISEIEKAIGKKAKYNFLPMQPGDVLKTWADISELQNDFGYSPKTQIETGIPKFIKWFKEFYKIK